MRGKLSLVSGEFVSKTLEARFQNERLPETVRQIRLILALSVVLNALFFASDWRFSGTDHFIAAVTARSVVIAISLLCGLLAAHITSFKMAEWVMVPWQLVVAGGAAVLVSTSSEIALLAIFLVPLIYLLAVPLSFFWTIISGLTASVLLLVGYQGFHLADGETLGLILLIVILDTALVIVLVRSNRLQRLEWLATRSARAAAGRLTLSQDRLMKMFMAVPIPLFAISRETGAVMGSNDAAVRFFGTTKESGQEGVLDGLTLDPDDNAKFLHTLEEHGQVRELEMRILLADGSERDVLTAAAEVEIESERLILAGVVDISRRKALENRLETLATTDPLTGLANRTQFFNAAEREIARAKRLSEQLAVVLLDVDHFKLVNDTLGHDVGDELLRAFAERLREGVRSSDIVARLGGDEFGIVMGSMSGQAEVARLVESLTERLRDPIIYNGQVVECRASVGASIYPVHADNLEELFKDADLALYEAKSAGRGSVRVFEPDMRSIMQERVSMVSKARMALNEDRILPFYQPKVSLHTGQVIGFEALLRWEHSEKGIQLPDTIAAAFDNVDVATGISERMLGCVIADMRRWLDEGIAFGHVGINASAIEFGHNNFAERVLERLAAANIPARYLEIEVTERVFLGRGAEYVGRALDLFSSAGVRIALDDFGTGYASLSHLKKFPVDVIKIDRSFVRDLADDPDDAAIIRAVANLGRSLGIKTVAEGIETAQQAAFVAAQGCDEGQGYLFGRPAPATVVPQVLEERKCGGTWWVDPQGRRGAFRGRGHR